ncbi:MAG: class I SAM-dependent methyltransferase [Methyloceanibacter sp.]|nr:class I SAM-dependent methyltransferase [Methyloceanibacter sp.]
MTNSPDNGGPGGSVARPGADAVAKAHAIYTPTSLSFYDFVVHGLSNRFAWRCPTSKIIDLYRQQLSANHLEAGAGTGLFLDRASNAFDRLVLLDINPHCLSVSSRRLHRFDPDCRQANLLEPLALDLAPFSSVALTYVLHCLPGSMAEKLIAVDHLMPLLARDATFFGATILGDGVRSNGPARALLSVYNKKGVFNNLEDSLQALTQGLDARFGDVKIEQQGLVALFVAR